MKVKPNQNPAVPVQGSEIADITDGTSNTLQIDERTKSEKPFAKDSFEVETSSKKENIIVYNGHAGLGENN